MPNCKSFLVTEAERKHVRRRANLVAVATATKLARHLTRFLSASVTRKDLQFGTWSDSSFQRHYRFRPTTTGRRSGWGLTSTPVGRVHSNLWTSRVKNSVVIRLWPNTAPDCVKFGWLIFERSNGADGATLVVSIFRLSGVLCCGTCSGIRMGEATLLRPRLSIINIDILLIEIQNIMHSWKEPASCSFELLFPMLIGLFSQPNDQHSWTSSGTSVLWTGRLF